MTWALLFLAQYAGTIAVGDRTEVRVRLPENNGALGSTPAVIEGATQPTVMVALTDRRWDHSFLYAPLLTARGDAAPGTTPEVLHSATLRTAWHTRRARFALSETLSYGVRRFGDLLRTVPASPGDTARTPIPLQLLPSTQSIHYGLSASTLEAMVAVARRWSLTTSVGYTISGGLDTESEAVLPQQRVVRVESGLGYAATRSDQLVSQVGASAVQIPNGPCDSPGAVASATGCERVLEFLQVGEAWNRQWTRETSTSLLFGLSIQRVRATRDAAFDSSIDPFVSAGLSHQVFAGRSRVLLRLNTRILPVVDQRTGIADTRTDSLASLEWSHAGTTLRGTTQYTQSISQSGLASIRAIQGEAVISQRLSRRFDVDGGYRITWQDTAGVSFRFSNAFVGLVYREPVVRF